MSITEVLVGEIRKFIDGEASQISVGMPGRVERYDASKQLADVQPLLKRGVIGEDGTRFAETLPVIPDVPVQWPGGAAGRLTIPLERGDGVWLQFSQGSLDKWANRGGIVDPGDDRHHDLSDAIAIPGLESFNRATAQVHATDAVLSATTGLRLGSKDASEPMLHGSAYISAESTHLDALTVYLDAMAVSLSSAGFPVAAAKATYATAQSVFKSAGTAAKSTKVKAD